MPDMRPMSGASTTLSTTSPNGTSAGGTAFGPTTPQVASGADDPAVGPDIGDMTGISDQTPPIGPRRGLSHFWAGSQDATD